MLLCKAVPGGGWPYYFYYLFPNQSSLFFYTFAPIMEKQQSSYKEKGRTRLREPRRFKVIIHNDDFTTMDFVVSILTTVFLKSSAEAEALMLKVHESQSAVVGVYSYDIAKSKVDKATRKAREAGFPLRLTMEPEEE